MAVSRARIDILSNCKAPQDFETTERRLFLAGKHGHIGRLHAGHVPPWAGLSPDITPWCDIVIVVGFLVCPPTATPATQTV
jgi:hypothetical protein